MGPRLGRRGNEENALDDARVHVRFNGATPWEAWKLVKEVAGDLKPDGLQWGHALGGVETLPTSRPWGWAVCVAVCEREAKMGRARGLAERGLA